MALTPAFEIGAWNAWIFIVPYILTNFGLSFLFINRKSTFWAWPSYTRLERTCLLAGMVLMCSMWIYSIFLPLSLGTAWFYTGLSVYLLGWIFLLLAMVAFIATPVERPNTTGIYRITKHPWYIGMFLIYIGTGVAGASWVYILAALFLVSVYRIAFMIPEERMCCERFGNAYREYMNKTPRWIGIPKSDQISNPN
jgi:protein-S-isoprenylcysteine O-methyltransferase Ste14